MAASLSVQDIVLKTEKKSWYDSIVLCESRFERKVFDSAIVVVLLYTALIFPYRLSFIELKLPEEARPTKDLLWVCIEWVVDGLFWLDLLVGFFATYRDHEGNEVRSNRRILRHYLSTTFLINLIACLPQEFYAWLAESGSRSWSQVGTQKLGRLVRLQRLTRLLRFVRLLRLAKFKSFAQKNVLWIWMQAHLPGMKLMDLSLQILLATHIMGCGWYLVAVIGEDPAESWLGRRPIHSDGRSLLDATGPVQWLHAIYFIFTVFTTVGFGDMSAYTPIEIIYVMLVMVVGTIFHSIIVGEMIGALTDVDARERSLATQKELVERYAEHAEISRHTKQMLDGWISRPVKAEVEFDRVGMRKLVTGSRIPRDIIGALPNDLFSGELVRNEFVSSCCLSMREGRPIPEGRFVVLLSVCASRVSYLREDILYHEYDHPFNVFLVLSGTFAYAKVESLPSNDKATGADESTLLRPYQFFSRRSYFGDLEVFTRQTARRCTVVCLSRGDLLVLTKKDLEAIREDFPDVAAAWEVHARRREHARVWKLRRRGTGLHKLGAADIAASIIQDRVRQKRERRKDATAVSSFGNMTTEMNQALQRSASTECSLRNGTIGVPTIGRLSEDVVALRGEVSVMNKEVAALRGDVKGIMHELQAVLQICKDQHKRVQL